VESSAEPAPAEPAPAEPAPAEPDIEALYGERPERFVTVRNEIVKELRAAGRRDDAKIVAALRRPSVAAWALNQVARQQPETIGALLDAGLSLRNATDRALAGRRGDLRGAQDAQRKALDAVLEAAVRFGGELGAGNADQLRRRAGNTLHAAMADAALAERLRAGRLDDDVDAPGFGFGLDVIPAPGDDDATDESAAAAADEARIAAERAALEAEVERRRHAADRLERAAVAAERTAREARRKADAAAADLARAQEALDACDP
jgi:hypothetical protein